MANQNRTTTLTNDKLERVQETLQEFKDDARKAEQESDLFMLAVYNDLIKVMSHIVTRSYARLEREDKAALNKAERALRKAGREGRESTYAGS